MKVGILGSGDVGRSLGRGFAAIGHDVRIGTRNPSAEALQEWTKAVEGRGSVGAFADAAEYGELVVVATLGTATLEVLGSVPAASFRGKVVIDTTNPLTFAPNSPPTLFVGHTDSLGEQVQRALPDARVVKAFNTVGNAHFFRPSFPGGPPDMLIAGNDPGAKRTVEGILTSFGWSTVDLGGIDGARALEPICLAWVRSAMALQTWDIAFKLLRK
jgi:8-hydroxy-5-deazaflavin:NADPH oxidoreductase